jgi:hypothetical protein
MKFFHTITWNGRTYFISFIDDYTRYDYILGMFKFFKVEIELRLNKRIKQVKLDRKGVYYGRYDGSSEQCSGPFAKFLGKNEIVP